jgi:RNA polymerase sigma-70 factor (ECF subfamily)
MELANVATRSASVAAEDLVSQHWAGLVRRLTLIVRDADEAEDLAQTAVLKALQAWPREQVRDPRAWLFAIGIRLALNETRRRKRFAVRQIQPDEAAEKTGDPDLWRALGSLEPSHRAALVMSVIDGYSYAEIADALGVPSGTVGSWISRAKIVLRKTLSEDPVDGPL